MKIIELIERPIKTFYHFCLNSISVFHHKMVNSKFRNKQTGSLKVCFIVQLPEIWDKEKSLYDSMLQDSNFEVQLLIVPSYDFVNDKVGRNYKQELPFFIKESKGKFILAFNKKGKIINLKKYGFEYIFYPRPYDNYLPREFRSFNVSKFSKVCFITYAYTGSYVFYSTSYNLSFIRNCSFVFLEEEESKQYINETMPNIIRRSCFFPFCGYPILEFLLKKNTIPSVRKSNTFLWTPRWSNDEKIGGSHFLNYKDNMIQLFKKYKENHFIVRPHPLMWDYFLKNGLLSINEEAMYKASFNECNCSLDKNELITSTFDKSDVLITDYSSMIVEFFTTGKPIIYCPSTNIPFNKSFQRLEKGMYIANSFNDIERFIQDLSNGIDPLFGVRKEIVDNLRKENIGTVEKIKKELIIHHNK